MLRWKPGIRFKVIFSAKCLLNFEVKFAIFLYDLVLSVTRFDWLSTLTTFSSDLTIETWVVLGF